MFYYLNGTVAEIGPNLAVIDCCGVGYSCATTNYTLAQLKKGERAKLFTYLYIRDDLHSGETYPADQFYLVGNEDDMLICKAATDEGNGLLLLWN